MALNLISCCFFPSDKHTNISFRRKRAVPDPNPIRLSILEGRPCGVDVKHERWYPGWSHLMCFRGWNQLPGLTAWDDWAENSPQRLHQQETHRRLWQHYEGTDSSVWSLHVYDSDSYLVSLARLLSVFRKSAYYLLCPCRQEATNHSLISLLWNTAKVQKYLWMSVHQWN